MNPRPWKISAFVFALLTLALIFDVKISVIFGKEKVNAPTQAVTYRTVPRENTPTTTQEKTAETSVEAATSERPKIPVINFADALGIPKFEKTGSPKTTVTDLLKTEAAVKLSKEFIPKEGFTTPYGLTLGLKTYEDMKKWNKTVSLEGASSDRAEKLMNEIYHPCCGAMINPKICGCGHAIGMSGLVKKMVQDGKSDSEVLGELMIWGKYFFPRHYVIMGLLQQKLGKSLDEIDLSQKFSSIDGEKPVVEYLTYQ